MAQSVTLNAKPTWPDVKNDYTLRYDGREIGRIRFDVTTWVWQVTIPMAMPEWASGTADSLDAAKRAFAGAWARILSETKPDRLERAWELQRSAEARLPRTESVPKSNS